MTSRLATQESKSKTLNIPILDIQSGATGLAAFLNGIPTFLNCYGHAGFEFIHAIDYSPKMPDDLAPSTSASHLHPTSPSDSTNRRESISTTLFGVKSSGVKEPSLPTLKLPQVAYMYERSSCDSSSTTANGHSLYLQDRKDWKDESKVHLKDRAECMSFLLINCFPPSTHKTIKKNRNFPNILQSNDLVAFHLLLHSLLVESTLIANVSSLATLFNIRQDSLSLEDFGNNVDDAMKLFTDQFCTDPHNPTMVDANDIHNCLYLIGVNNSMRPFLNTIMSKTAKLRDFTPEGLFSDMCSWSATNKVLNSTRPLKNPKPNKDKGKTIPSESTQALLSHSSGESCWSAFNPHSRPRNLTDGPKGNPSLPHCSHCFKNGYVFNNHTKDGCKDLLRLSSPQAPSTSNKSSPLTKPPPAQALKTSWANRQANKGLPSPVQGLVADSEESTDEDAQSDLQGLISALAAIDNDPSSSLSAFMTSTTPQSDDYYLKNLGTQASGANLSTR